MANRNYFMWTYPHIPDFYMYHEDEHRTTYVEATYHSIAPNNWDGNGPREYWMLRFGSDVTEVVAKNIYNACIKREGCYDFVIDKLTGEDAETLCDTIDDLFLADVPFQQVELPSDAK
jgi:hypothetical protein